jgi:hypothetical protein
MVIAQMESVKELGEVLGMPPTFIPRGKGFDLPCLISDTFLYIGKGTLVAIPNDGSGQSYFPTTTLGKYRPKFHNILMQ